MRQAAGARADSVPRALQRADVNDRELLALSRSSNHGLQRLLRQGREGHSKLLPIVIDDLDIIRSLGDPVIYELLPFVRRVERRNWQAVLRAMSAARGDERSRRAKIRQLWAICAGKLFPALGEHAL